jgi:hypothetical protein
LSAFGCRGDHLADAQVEIVAHVCTPLDHALDLERRDVQPASDLLRRRVDTDVLAQPGERCSH